MVLYFDETAECKTTRTGYLCSLINGPAIIFGLALLHLILTWLWVGGWYRAFGQSPVDFYPDSFVVVPLLLLVAAVLLVVRKWWGFLLAFLIGLWVLYAVGYLG